MPKITAPAGKAVAGLDAPGGNRFDKSGSFETSDEAVIAYCKAAGYEVGGSKSRPLDTSEIAAFGDRARLEGKDLPRGWRKQLAEQDPDEVRKVLAEPVDPRTLDTGVVGTPLRDAAVDPRPEDFLPPTNAGEANPHGPLVVSPGIHAIETQVVRPGPVHVEDLAAQQKAETAQAEALLVERRLVSDVIPAPADADRGPLGLSDPGSVTAVDTGDTTDQERPTNPDGSVNTDAADPADLKGAALDQALEDAGLSKAGTVAEKRARLAEHRTATA